MNRISRIHICVCIFIHVAGMQRLAAQEKDVMHSNQQWVQYYCQVLFTEKWSLQGDTGFRWREGFSERAQYLFRLGAGYRISPSWQLTAGILYSGTYGPEQVDRTEFRPYQDLTYRMEVRKVEVNQRFRVEEQFFHPVDAGPDEFRVRIRYNLSVTVPLFRLSASRPERALNLIVGDEMFLHSESRAFDRNRLTIGPSLRWNPSLVIGLQWCSQYSATPDPWKDQQNQIVWLTVRQQFRIHPKKSATL